jgi:hypothetical protein
LKNINDFFGEENRCKTCRSEYSKLRRKELLQKLDSLITEKKCIRCKILKNINDFYKESNECKKCKTEHDKNKRQELIQKRLENPDEEKNV